MGGAILIVEDEPITQKLIAVNLERAGHQVMRAASVPEAVAAIRDVLPDLVLLDWILPNATGVSFARQLLARIKAVIRRRAPLLSDEVVEIAGLRLDPAAHRIVGNGHKIDLKATEFRLLHFFMTHPDRVYSRAQLLDEVWGDHVFVEERTVDVHIRRVRQVLAPSGHEGLIETVRGMGYRFRRQPA